MYKDAPGKNATCEDRPSQKDFVHEAPLSSSGLRVPYTNNPTAEHPMSLLAGGAMVRSFSAAVAADFSAPELRLRACVLLFEAAANPDDTLLAFAEGVPTCVGVDGLRSAGGVATRGGVDGAELGWRPVAFPTFARVPKPLCNCDETDGADREGKPRDCALRFVAIFAGISDSKAFSSEAVRVGANSGSRNNILMRSTIRGKASPLLAFRWSIPALRASTKSTMVSIFMIVAPDSDAVRTILDGMPVVSCVPMIKSTSQASVASCTLFLP